MANTPKDKTKKKNRYPGVYQRGDSWGFHAEGPRQPNGKRKQITRSGFPTQKAAWEAKVALLDEINKGTYKMPTKATFQGLLEFWLETIVKVNSAYSTYESARFIVKRVCPILGHIKADDLKEIHFHNHYQQLLEEGLARNTIKNHHSVLKSALRRLKKLKMIKQNVLLDVDPPKVERKEPRFMTEKEVDQLLTAIKNSKAPYYYDVCLFAVATGVRIGEALALKWQDINQEEQTIEICRSFKRGPNGIVEGTTKTKKNRTLKYGELIKEILAHRRTKQRKERLQFGSAYQDNGYVFSQPFGNPYNTYSVSMFVSQVADRLGMPDVTFHTLRHTNASILLSQNVDIFKIRASLGHSSLEMTAHYAHVSKHDSTVANTMDNVLSITTKKRLG